MKALPTPAALRRRLASVTHIVPAALIPPASHGQSDHATIVPARLLYGIRGVEDFLRATRTSA